jgi:hypothetical protein
MQTKRVVPRNSANNFFTAIPLYCCILRWPLTVAIGMKLEYGAAPKIFHIADPYRNEQLVNKRKTPPAMWADGVPSLMF